ncbi:MAG: ubiquinol-cytochrome c reductase iron-sulfur subunit [Vicinamibacterales bacterium]
MTRRAALGGMAAGLASAVACDGRRPPPAASVPLADLSGGRRVVVQVGPAAVEVRQEGGEVAARYLVCSHMGCRVSPDPASGGYRCACHDGRYDAAGRPSGGPPTGPLPDAPFAIEDGAVVFRLE